MCPHPRNTVRVESGTRCTIARAARGGVRRSRDPTTTLVGSSIVKVLPFLSLIYLVYPDLIPGPFDDAVVITIFLQFFLALIPDELIEEIRLDQEIAEQNSQNESQVIEGEFWEE